MAYDAPFQMAAGQIPLPDGDFVFHLHTNKERFVEMLGFLCAGNAELGLEPVGDHNIDVLNSLAAWDQDTLPTP